MNELAEIQNIQTIELDFIKLNEDNEPVKNSPYHSILIPLDPPYTNLEDLELTEEMKRYRIKVSLRGLDAEGKNNHTILSKHLSFEEILARTNPGGS